MKRKNIKWLIIVFLIFISIGFAVLTANLNILTKLSFQDNTFDIHFDNIKITDYDIESPEVNLEGNTSISFSGTLKKPGDYLEFTFNVVNAGTIDAQLESISTSLTAEQQKYIDYSLVYYTDNLEVLKNDIIYAGQARKIKARFNFKYDIENIPSFENLEVTISLKYIQPKEVSTTVWNYDFAGMEQVFYAPKNGNYKIELWGASGGSNLRANATGGKGGYVSGNISLSKNEILYVYVGENPTLTFSNCLKSNPNHTFNGTNTGTCAAGGGATDIRLKSGEWDDIESLKSRIMVAAGGGGALYVGHSGSGGGLIGGDGEGKAPESSGYDSVLGVGGTQIGESFGIIPYKTCGAGNGYYAGTSGMAANAGGGSSYISGHTGCVAIKSEDDVTPKDGCDTGNSNIECSKHYSGKFFTETVMIDGDGYQWTTEKGSQIGMPDHKTSGKVNGNQGNGFARITFLG